MDTILELKEIDMGFFGVNVLKQVDLKLGRGEILGLCGENGAGKSTLMNILGGVYQRDGGRMLIDGQPYEPQNPIDAKDAGVAFIHQELNLFLNLTVRQNFMIDDLPKTKRMRFIDTAKIKKVAEQSLEEMGEEIPVDALVEDLNIGQRQLVEIAKETAKNARIVIFDEPTSSLSNREKEKLFRVIRSMSQKGISIIYISHIIDDVFDLCDSIAVLRDGRTIGADKVGNLTRAQVINMMVGRELTKLYPYVEKTVKEELFAVRHIRQGGKLDDVSFSLKKGEIVGMFGLMGAGRSELANAIFGVDPIDSGEVVIDGEEIRKPEPGAMKARGIAYITENRREDGLLMPKSLKDNLVLTCLKELRGKNRMIDRRREQETAGRMIGQLNIKTYDMNRQTAAQLSGGNQQKVVFGKWLATQPRVFLLDEPTRGVDVGAKYEIYSYINELALQDSTVLFISSEIEELMGVCDRILVMGKGRIVGEMNRAEYDQAQLLSMAVGSGV